MNGYVRIEGKCERCGGPVVREWWGADCRGNPGGTSIGCEHLCYHFFDYGLEMYRPKTDPSLWETATRIHEPSNEEGTK